MDALKFSKFNMSQWIESVAAFQNVSCYVFEQSIVFHNVAVQSIYNVFYFNAVKKQSGIGFIVDALLDNFAYLHSLLNCI